MFQKVEYGLPAKSDALQDTLIIAKCHTFPNMYDMLQAKVDRLAGKTYLVQKNT